MRFKLKFCAGLLCGALAVGTLFSGCSKIDSNATIVTIDDGADTISLGYYNFAAKYQQAIYDVSYSYMLGDEMWSQDFGGSEGTMEESVKNGVLDMLEEAYLAKKHAADYGIELSEDEQKKISDSADSFIEENSDEAIKMMGASKEFITKYLEDRYYSESVRKAVRDETKVSVSDKEAAQSTISYVFYSTEPQYDSETGESTELTDEEKEAVRAKAETLLNAEDFDKVAEDSEETVETYSYDINKDSYDDERIPAEVFTAAKKLEDGERSEIIETEDGYYLVRMDAKDDKDASAARKAEIEEQQRSDHYDEVLDGWKSQIDWKVDKDQLAKVKFDKMFEMIEDPNEDTAEE